MAELQFPDRAENSFQWAVLLSAKSADPLSMYTVHSSSTRNEVMPLEDCIEYVVSLVQKAGFGRRGRLSYNISQKSCSPPKRRIHCRCGAAILSRMLI